MTIKERNQNFFTRYHHLLAPLLTVLLGYAGYDQYGEYQARQAAAAAAPAEVTVNIENPQAQPATSEHRHVSVTSEAEINRLIQAAIKAHETSDQYHEF